MKRLDRIPVKYRKEIGTQLRDLSQRIQNRREALEMTQEKLAEDLDISAVMLKAIEQGKRYPSLPMLFYICRFLKIEIKITNNIK